jgi:serine-type D-Ala-D-Ala carboxypeptidase/endopeptidase (penicillin-binding protein 4)
VRVRMVGPSLRMAFLLTSIAGCTATVARRSPDRANGVQTLARVADSVIDRSPLRTAVWGILVFDPEGGDTLYSRNPDKAMVPASTMKLATTATALAQLGADYRFRTLFGVRREPANGVIDGDLIVIGRGDPTVSDRMQGDARRAMLAIADSLVARGVKEIRGKLVSAGDAFPDPPFGTGWAWDDLGHAFGAGVDELLFDEGRSTAADSTLSLAASRMADMDYLKALGAALSERGVTIGGAPARDTATVTDTIFVLQSPPLKEILPVVLGVSQNQIAEVLLRAIALEKTGTGRADSGSRIVERQLERWGAPVGSYRVHDGSGLSRSDLLSPRALGVVLSAVRKDSSFGVFYRSLPVAGEEGTLRNRMRGTAGAGAIRGKTGTLESTRSLAGYARTTRGRELVFVIMCNGAIVEGSAILAAIDAIAVRIPQVDAS